MSEEIACSEPVSVKAGQIQFVEACHPALVAGRYNVEMTQKIKESDGGKPLREEPYKSNFQFAVDAPRFTLDPADIHAVYPPANQTGKYDHALPHVVFNRRTLPWERTLNREPPKHGQPFPPWMGLLLVQEDELIIRGANGRRYEVCAMPVVGNGKDQDSLLFPKSTKDIPKENILVPDLGQDKWDSEIKRYENASCLALDLPAALFKAIAPRIEDLPYLAHVRQIDTGAKEVQAVNDRGWFSLVMGNRLPQPDKDQRALLVSLEGHQERIGSEKEWKPCKGCNHDNIPQEKCNDLCSKSIRLAVLSAWRFKCEGLNDFKAYMGKLELESLHLPFAPYNDASIDAGDIVNGAYSRGYTAFNHFFRHGEKTVSWYRGPLVPLNYDKPTQIQEPVSSADELLRYDPTTGLFDVTYAAAWQLGRLLALQNQSFALALNRVRKILRQVAEERMRRKEIEDRFGFAEEDFVGDCFMRALNNRLDKKLLEAVRTLSALY